MFLGLSLGEWILIVIWAGSCLTLLYMLLGKGRF